MISHAEFSLLEMTVRKKMGEVGKAKGNIHCDACLAASQREKYQRIRISAPA